MRFRRPGSGQKGLFDQLDHAKRLQQTPTSLDRLNELVDFEDFREILIDLLGYGKGTDKGGNAPFDPVFMFKIMVLQKFYGLSEEATEFQIRDRFSFLRFLELQPGDEVPDKNTIWDFKERLGADGVRNLFEDLNGMLAQVGVRGQEGKMVDASFVEVPRQRNSRKENQQIKEGEEPEDWEKVPAKRRQKDIDARWAKKNHQVHYGYKNHIKADVRTKLIEDYLVSAANEHDSQCFESLVEQGDDMVYADSAYRSRESLAMLRKKKIKARLNQKGQKNRPLTERQKGANRKKSRIRARVEHIFGYQSATMGADEIRTIGIMRAAREIGMGNLVYNLMRCVTLGVNLRSA
jgi:IS5 family transposase